MGMPTDGSGVNPMTSTLGSSRVETSLVAAPPVSWACAPGQAGRHADGSDEMPGKPYGSA
jgi:hypothetical protein